MKESGVPYNEQDAFPQPVDVDTGDAALSVVVTLDFSLLKSRARRFEG